MPEQHSLLSLLHDGERERTTVCRRGQMEQGRKEECGIPLTGGRKGGVGDAFIIGQQKKGRRNRNTAGRNPFLFALGSPKMPGPNPGDQDFAKHNDPT